MRVGIVFTSILLLLPIFLRAQSTPVPSIQDYWHITKNNTIVWDITQEKRLPHKDNIEMAGKKVAAILYYEIDEERRLTLQRDVIFPQLRTFNKSNEPDWKKYRAYFRRTFTHEATPSISCNDKLIVAEKVDSVEIGGLLRFHFTQEEGLQVTKTIYPAMEERFLVENWRVKNVTDKPLTIAIANSRWRQREEGYKGEYSALAYSTAQKELITLAPGAKYNFPVYYGATLNEESPRSFSVDRAREQRKQFLRIIRSNLILETPDPIINRLFDFAKIRAAESIFNSSMGLVHSPGGGNYYAGIWANDQIEYSGPFFPTLGYEAGNTAAFNAYRMFAKNIPTTDTHIPYAFEVDGNFPMTQLDRGDAAMTAYGTAHYLLARGNREQAEQLWPLVEWCLNYCHTHRNEAGAVVSESDEMEGRIETGSANLSTSSLYYGGLKYAIPLAKELGRQDLAIAYAKRLDEMEGVIENYFGATMEGQATYKYFAENRYLRHWICLPLVMGITERQEGTLTALFDKLWTKDGILVELNPEKTEEPPVFWDRATLYALRGALKTDATGRAYPKLSAYSRTRLLGEHVPYPIEAYPENDQKHLSAESALYCRIFTEGMLGLEPLGLSSVRLTPQLPADWNQMSLRQLHLGEQPVDVTIVRMGVGYQIKVMAGDQQLVNKDIKKGESVVVKY